MRVEGEPKWEADSLEGQERGYSQGRTELGHLRKEVLAKGMLETVHLAELPCHALK